MHSVCCKTAAQLLKVSPLMTVLKITGCLEGQHRLLPGYVRLPKLGRCPNGFSREARIHEGKRRSQRVREEALFRNEEQEMKFQLRDAAPSLLRLCCSGLNQG